MSYIEEILHHLGLGISRYEPVHGGDINQSYCLYAGDHKYFLKLNDAAQFPDMFEKEARGLEALCSALPNNELLLIPHALKHGIANDQQYLLLQWIPAGSPQKNFWENFGRAVATLHRQHHELFGWYEDNYIGSLIQRNDRHESWHSFFTECRVMPLVQQLYNSGSFSKQDLKNAESFCQNTEQLFPAEPPSLVHGDLWGGNFMISTGNRAAIFDPAVYFGHREMDIGMTKLFGGFDQGFYNGYNSVYPLEPKWQQRLDYSQLYPLLVHAVLFGGHYCNAARSILRKF